MRHIKELATGVNPIYATESGDLVIYSISVPKRDLNTVRLKMERIENGWLNVIEWKITNSSVDDG